MDIRIRAWDKTNKEMIHDLICFYPPNSEYNKGDAWGISHSNKFNSDNGYMWGVRDLIPMIYSGVKDKKGNPIFEGDILKFNGILWECRFCPLEFTFVWVIPDGSYQSYEFKYWESEVIGNIYKNPELIKI